MANTYKDIVITPNKGSSTDDPKIVFSGGNTSVNTDITLRVYPDSNGTLSFEGSAGQLFSVTNDLTGSLFTVNDVSGIPSIEVDALGNVDLAPFGGNVGIGTSNPVFKLDVQGDARITGNLTLGDATTDTITVNAANFNLANNVSFDSGTLFIDKSNDRIGIGTTSPIAKLDVNGSIAITAAGARIVGDFINATVANRVLFQSSSANTNTSVGAIPNGTGTAASFTSINNSDPTNSAYFAMTAGSTDARIRSDIIGAGAYIPITLWTGGSERMRIDNSGNVGIGTSSPGSKLHIEQTGISTTTTVMNTVTEANAVAATIFDFDQYTTVDGGGSSMLRFRKANGTKASPTVVGANRATGRVGSQIYDGTAFYDNGLILFSADGTPATGSTPGRIQFYTTASGSTTLAERMRIDANGNIGIGTSSPITKLHIQRSAGAASLGEIFSSDGTYWTMLNSRQSGTAYSSLVQGNDHAIIYSDGSADTGAFVIAQWSNSARGMRIDSSGNVGIGTASPLGKLTVTGGASGTSVTIGSTDIGTGTWIRNDGVHTVFSTNIGSMYFGLNGSSKNLLFYPGGSTAALTVGTDSIVTASYQLRAPIFYDSDNTAYYVDPAGTSVLTRATLIGSTSTGIVVNDGGGSANYNYVMSAANDTGTKLVMFINGSARSADGGTNALTIRNDGGNLNLGAASYLTSLYGTYTLAYNSMRSPIFYDSDNTAYYVDPGNATVLNGLYSNFLRLGPTNIGGQAASAIGAAYGLNGTGASLFAWNYSSGGGELDLIINRNGGGTGGLNVYDFTSNTITNLMTLTGAGNLGLGTTSPRGKLDVYRHVTHTHEWASKAYTGGTWYRFLTLNATNQGQELRVVLRNPNGHDSVEITIAKHTTGAGNAGVVASIRRLGSYAYTHNITKIRICDDGTNSTTHLEVQFGANHTSTLNMGLIGLINEAFTVVDMTTGAVGSSSTKELFVSDGVSATTNQTMIGYSTLSNDLMYLNTNGNLGIGTTSPGNKLSIGSTASTSTATPDTMDLGGTFRNTAGGAPKLRVWTDGTNHFGIGISSGQMEFTTTQAAAGQVWYTAGTEKMRLLAGGNLGIGTASPAYKLEVSGTAHFTGKITSGVTAGTDAIDLAASDGYASLRVARNNGSSSNDGMYIGYGNAGTGTTKIYGGGVTTGALEKFSTYTLEPGSFRSPIFYDSNNTAYYVDPGSNSKLFGYLTLNHTPGSTNLEDNTGLVINNNYTDGRYSHRFRKWDDGGGVPLYVQKTSGTANVWSSIAKFGSYTSDASEFAVYGYGYATASWRAPIFYDSDNTAYYVDPASTSILNKVILSNGSSGVLNGLDDYHQIILRGYPSNATTGITATDVTSFSEYGGDFRFYRKNGSSLDLLTEINTDYLSHYSDIRTPIFYDSNNTGYYLDPAGFSRTSAISSDQLRVYNGGVIMWQHDGAGANNKFWDTYSDSAGVLRFRAVNDAYNAATEWLNVTRSGQTPQLISLYADTSIPTNSLSFGTSVRQMINLWSTSFGIGIQNNTQYFRSGSRFSWFIGGVHSASENDAGSGGVSAMTLTNGNLTVSGSISDTYGSVRRAPVDSKSAQYTLVATDTGKTISITTGGIIIPANVMSAGDIVTIFNNSGSSQTITTTGVTAYLAGTATTGDRTLLQRGVANILCVASNVFVISGSGLT